VNTTLADVNERTTNISYVENTENNTTTTNTTIAGDKVTISGVLSTTDIANVNTTLTDVNTTLADVNTTLADLNRKTTNMSYLTKTNTDTDTVVKKTVFDSSILFQDQEAIPNHDGALYKYKDNFELMVHDNFYIRDGENSEGTPEFNFSTKHGLYLYKGNNAIVNNKDRTDNKPGFEYNSDETQHDRIRIKQDCDGGGGHFYYNRSHNFGKSSDARIKENIEDLTQEDVDFLLSIKPRKYKLKHRELNCCQYGVIAQEVMEVCNPDSMPQKAIVNNFDDYYANPDTEELLGISYDNFIPLLIKLTQQQQQKINKLETDIKSIKSTLSL
jgi:hypothetical protein